MKRVLLAICAIVVVAACIGYFRKGAGRDSGSAETSGQTENGLPANSISSAKQDATARSTTAKLREATAAATTNPVSGATAVVTGGVAVPTIDPAIISRAIDTVLATNSTYAQKQAAWKQLIEAGKLDDAIAALEQKRAAEPLVADFAATLGHAYIKKCGTINDMRDQGLLAMSADKLFDTALGLDPGNWEARFTKAVSMSYWPPNMNKGEEVIGHFQTLIQQQELKPAQPEFAETYLWLGDQYQKMGQRENAVAVWGRGATLFPTHESLRNRLAPGAAGK